MTIGITAAKSRVKLALLGSSVNFISTFLSFLVFFITVPLTITYLGEERFGIWMTVASISSMLSFMDFGVGNGLVSQVAKSRISADPKALQNTISRGFSLLLLIGLVVGVLLSVANMIKPLADVLIIESDQAREDARQLVSTFIVLFALSIPLNGLFKILMGMQLSWMVHVARSIGSVVSIIAVYLLAREEARPAYLLIATYGLQVLMAVCVLPYYFRHQLLSLRTNSNWAEARAEYRNLVSFGGLFLILQLGVMAGWGADSLFISTLSGASAVAQFAIAQKLFQLVSIPVNIVNAPLWGAYADAHAQGDTQFIRKTLRISLLGTLAVSSVLSVMVYLASDLLIELWIKKQIEVSGTLLLGFAVWRVLESLGNSFSMALNGMHIVKLQVISVLMLCALVVPLKLYFTPLYGAQAVIWCTIVAYTLSTVLFYLFTFRKYIVEEFASLRRR